MSAREKDREKEKEKGRENRKLPNKISVVNVKEREIYNKDMKKEIEIGKKRPNKNLEVRERKGRE